MGPLSSSVIDREVSDLGEIIDLGRAERKRNGA
jgi:hypothetical protein